MSEVTIICSFLEIFLILVIGIIIAVSKGREKFLTMDRLKRINWKRCSKIYVGLLVFFLFSPTLKVGESVMLSIIVFSVIIVSSIWRNPPNKEEREKLKVNDVAIQREEKLNKLGI